ncbi:hypothetical protein SDC9_158710 [bioreactor metagenome]|uniref:Uncharacterized protein n=1 Tax=bioreactor metagenome TaxID=1076179 RepID=A0A645FDG7_9ZZZZ
MGGPGDTIAGVGQEAGTRREQAAEVVHQALRLDRAGRAGVFLRISQHKVISGGGQQRFAAVAVASVFEVAAFARFVAALDQAVENADQAAAHVQSGHWGTGQVFGRFVDVHQLAVEQGIAPAAAGPFVHAGADGEDQIDVVVVEQGAGRRMAGKTEDAPEQRMVGTDQPFAVGSGDEGNVALDGQLQDGADGFAAPAADQQADICRLL